MFVVNSVVKADTYLETSKNYYKLDSINRGFLDQEISESILGSEIWNMFQVAVSKNLVNYEPGMTFNQYYISNNISPEDNFTVYPKLTNQLVKLSSGAYLNANINPKGATDSDGNVVDYITYVGPTDDRGAYWGDTELEDPVLFSRLTVGDLPKSDNPKLVYFSKDDYQFSTQIGYGESGTANDYMLTSDNNFIIPTRYNEIRSDIYLTMRSRAYFGAGIQGAQASLSATSGGNDVVGSQENSKFYIDTNSSVFITPQGFDQLGTFSKFLAPSVYTSASASLQNVGVNKFSEAMNAGLKTIQTNSQVNNIVSGNGGQIQLTGFYRNSLIESNFLSDNESRIEDSKNLVDVNFYMYTDGNTEATVTTPLAPNGYHLYSPNVSEFKIETTRPYFESFNNGDQSFQMNDVLSDFDNRLGSNSLNVIDNGVRPNGDKILVDKDRIKIRVSLDNGSTYSDVSYSFSELEEAFQQNTFNNEQITLAYTYAATDSNDSNIGKLPVEIEDNTGAYAVPFIRTVTPDPVIEGAVVTRYVDEDGKEISSQNKTTGKVGTDYTTIEKEISGYIIKEVPANKEGTYTDGVITVTYVYSLKDTPTSTDKNDLPTQSGETTHKELPTTNSVTNPFLPVLGLLVILGTVSAAIYYRKNR